MSVDRVIGMIRTRCDVHGLHMRLRTLTAPSELTTIDYKGQFRLRDGRYCYPLTLMDWLSRYLLACEALLSTDFSHARPVVERVFREHGLPKAMPSDNGPP